jgi:hypothetical protein
VTVVETVFHTGAVEITFYTPAIDPDGPRQLRGLVDNAPVCQCVAYGHSGDPRENRVFQTRPGAVGYALRTAEAEYTAERLGTPQEV